LLVQTTWLVLAQSEAALGTSPCLFYLGPQIMGCGKSKEPYDPPPPGGGNQLEAGVTGSRGSPISRLSAAGNKFVLIKFFKPNDPDMDVVHKAFTDLSDAYPLIIFMEADASVNLDAVSELQIKKYPAFVAFREHTEVGRYEGSNMDELRALVDALHNHIQKVS